MSIVRTLYAAAALASLILGACGGERDSPNTREARIDARVAQEMDRGARLLEDGHLEQAIESFNWVIKEYPLKSAEAYAKRGLIHLLQDREGNGIADISMALEIDPEFALARNYKGIVFAMHGFEDQAILEFTRAIELEPGLTDAYVNRGKAYLEMGDGESALADLDMAVSLEPEDAGLLLIRAQINLITGDTGRAEADLERVLSLPADERALSAARQLLSRIR